MNRETRFLMGLQALQATGMAVEALALVERTPTLVFAALVLLQIRALVWLAMLLFHDRVAAWLHAEHPRAVAIAVPVPNRTANSITGDGGPETCPRCAAITQEDLVRHLSGHILFVDDCPVCRHIQENLDAAGERESGR